MGQTGPTADTERVTSETDLIATYLAPLSRTMPGAFDLKDDAALIETESDVDLILSTDPVIAGVHFLHSDRADDIAWKALAVNVSDLIAKGGEPLGYTMALAFPAPPLRSWMALFVDGLRAAQSEFGIGLIGGDTDRSPGPLSIAITAIGAVPRDQFVPRNGARAGDHVFVTGTLGDSALGLKLHSDVAFLPELNSGDRSFLIGRYLRPSPRLAMARLLRTYATAALDISDGFVKDLRRLAGQNTQIEVEFARLPLSVPCRAVLALDMGHAGSVLAGGDDYEVLCAISPADITDFVSEARHAGVAVTELAVLTPGTGVRIISAEGANMTGDVGGFDHFAV